MKKIFCRIFKRIKEPIKDFEIVDLQQKFGKLKFDFADGSNLNFSSYIFQPSVNLTLDKDYGPKIRDNDLPYRKMVSRIIKEAQEKNISLLLFPEYSCPFSIIAGVIGNENHWPEEGKVWYLCSSPIKDQILKEKIDGWEKKENIEIISDSFKTRFPRKKFCNALFIIFRVGKKLGVLVQLKTIPMRDKHAKCEGSSLSLGKIIYGLGSNSTKIYAFICSDFLQGVERRDLPGDNLIIFHPQLNLKQEDTEDDVKRFYRNDTEDKIIYISVNWSKTKIFETEDKYLSIDGCSRIHYKKSQVKVSDELKKINENKNMNFVEKNKIHIWSTQKISLLQELEIRSTRRNNAHGITSNIGEVVAKNSWKINENFDLPFYEDSDLLLSENSYPSKIKENCISQYGCVLRFSIFAIVFIFSLSLFYFDWIKDESEQAFIKQEKIFTQGIQNIEVTIKNGDATQEIEIAKKNYSDALSLLKNLEESVRKSKNPKLTKKMARISQTKKQLQEKISLVQRYSLEFEQIEETLKLIQQKNTNREKISLIDQVEEQILKVETSRYKSRINKKLIELKKYRKKLILILFEKVKSKESLAQKVTDLQKRTQAYEETLNLYQELLSLLIDNIMKNKLSQKIKNIKLKLKEIAEYQVYFKKSYELVRDLEKSKKVDFEKLEKLQKIIINCKRLIPLFPKEFDDQNLKKIEQTYEEMKKKFNRIALLKKLTQIDIVSNKNEKNFLDQVILYKKGKRLYLDILNKSKNKNLNSKIRKKIITLDKKIKLLESPFELTLRQGQKDTLKKYDDNFIRKGWRYRIYFKSHLDCYLYIFQVDSSKSIWPIFPNTDGKIPDWKYQLSNNIQAKDRHIVPPGDQKEIKGDSPFELDAQDGFEKFYFVYNKSIFSKEAAYAAVRDHMQGNQLRQSIMVFKYIKVSGNSEK